jgi:uncharacterized membrane protein YhaH (DUF805 family)
MTFSEAISAGFQNYVNFSGRASRSELWYWVLFAFLVSIAAFLVDYSLFSLPVAIVGGPISLLASLGLLLPNLSVAVRRLHDIDRTGWWVLLALIPVVGLIVLVIWGCQRGTVGPNRFGPEPMAGTTSLGRQVPAS